MIISLVWLIPFNSCATVGTQFIKKTRKNPIFESLPFLHKSMFSGWKTLSHANSACIIYSNKNGGEWWFNPSVHQAKGDGLQLNHIFNNISKHIFGPALPR